MTYIIKNRTTGEYLKEYEYHRYGMAEHTAVTLTRKSREEGTNHEYIAVEKR